MPCTERSPYRLAAHPVPAEPAPPARSWGLVRHRRTLALGASLSLHAALALAPLPASAGRAALAPSKASGAPPGAERREGALGVHVEAGDPLRTPPSAGRCFSRGVLRSARVTTLGIELQHFPTDAPAATWCDLAAEVEADQGGAPEALEAHLACCLKLAEPAPRER